MEERLLPGENFQLHSLEQSIRWKTQVLKVRLLKNFIQALLSNENELLRLAFLIMIMI